ncbi:hypothetical protein [uncultured Novosphingobium sp.]|uniref:hypothetical protein n=1 Tax=uncultured Novosphingobium sp. TaxID=292277 RepID=UPI00374A257E
MSKITSGLGSLKSSLNAKGRIKRKGPGKGIGKGSGKGSGKGASHYARMKRIKAKQSKAPKVTKDIRVIDNTPVDSIFAGVHIDPPKVDDANDFDIDDEGPIDLGSTTSEKTWDVEHSNDEEVPEDDRDDSSQVWINDDLDEPDDDLDLDDLSDLEESDDLDDFDLDAPPPDKTSLIYRLREAEREKNKKLTGSSSGKSKKPNRSKGGKGKKFDRSKLPEGIVTLPMLDTIPEIVAWQTETFDAFEAKCLRATARKKALDPYRPALNAIIAGEVFTSTPMLTMRVVLDLGRQHLQTGMLRAVEGDSALRIYLITIIAGQGLTSHAKTDIDLGGSLAREQAFLRDVSRDYFAVHELAIFNSHGHPDGGQMLQRHTHAVVLLREGDPDPQVAIAKHLKHFEPNFTDIPIFDVRPVDTDDINLARVAAYMCKAPDRCKSWREGKDGKRGFINDNESGDRPSRYLRMAMIRSMLSLEDATFAGGFGAQIRTGLINTARAQCAAEAPAASRLLHPDAIGSFWTDVMRALNRKSWNLPVIRTRK